MEDWSAHDCPHRLDIRSDNSGVDPSESRYCGLTQEILGSRNDVPIASAAHCKVTDPVCVACQSTFEPTLQDPNPVVASLVYGAAELLLSERELDDEVSAHLSERRDFADANLPRVLPTESDLQPNEVAVSDREITFAELMQTLPIKNGDEELLRHPKWSVGLTTAPRRQPTLKPSLEGLMRCGWLDPHLFVDGDLDLTDSDLADLGKQGTKLKRTTRSSPAGAWHNFLLSLTEMVDRYPSSDAYLMVQDDIAWPNAPDLRRYMDHFLGSLDQRSIISFYTSVDDQHDENGWHQHPGPWEYGALAFIFPRRIARRIVTDPWLRRYSWTHGPGVAGVDTVLGKWAQRRGVEVWHPVPSIIQHTGHVSTIWRTARAVGLRRAGAWIGQSTSS